MLKRNDEILQYIPCKLVTSHIAYKDRIPLSIMFQAIISDVSSLIDIKITNVTKPVEIKIVG